MAYKQFSTMMTKWHLHALKNNASLTNSFYKCMSSSAASKSLNVGFIGLGNMGARMANNLIKKVILFSLKKVIMIQKKIQFSIDLNDVKLTQLRLSRHIFSFSRSYLSFFVIITIRKFIILRWKIKWHVINFYYQNSFSLFFFSLSLAVFFHSLIEIQNYACFDWLRKHIVCAGDVLLFL